MSVSCYLVVSVIQQPGQSESRSNAERHITLSVAKEHAHFIANRAQQNQASFAICAVDETSGDMYLELYSSDGVFTPAHRKALAT